MAYPEISIREFRNCGGDVVQRVEAGQRLTVTRAGKPVAELRPLRRPPLPAHELLQRWRTLPQVDPDSLRNDLDSVIDGRL